MAQIKHNKSSGTSSSPTSTEPTSYGPNATTT